MNKATMSLMLFMHFLRISALAFREKVKFLATAERYISSLQTYRMNQIQLSEHCTQDAKCERCFKDYFTDSL